jgi:ADP-ribosylglycohydrolase
VPQAIRSFLESRDVEVAIRLAISLGGDSDTLACMAGGIAQAFYGGVPGRSARGSTRGSTIT